MLNRQETAAMARVDRLLSEPGSAPRCPAPVGLRARIMHELRGAQPVGSLGLSIGPWAIILAACLVLAVGLAVQPWKRPAPAGLVANGGGMVSVPLEPSGMIRLVTNSVDAPLREQADRMMSDTRRATRAIVRRVPFTGRGG